MEGTTKAPEFELRSTNDADLEAFYGLFAQAQSIHAEAEPEFFRSPEKGEGFRQYFDGIPWASGQDIRPENNGWILTSRTIVPLQKVSKIVRRPHWRWLSALQLLQTGSQRL
ncbi:MAG: hypothetical protein QNJ06_13250 [Kiloniellales bacterium]|nr:hypothetical protein [Kiloniellales bacterium]MDJ0970855.1 hypothetical protein [Kiloniellales bacterium]MDJ0982497.1 hypothetical protein [Kiloniellales bacterium]